MKKLPEIPRNQRVIIEHVTGKLAGISQIVGHTDHFMGQQPPPLLKEMQSVVAPAKIDAGLVKAKPRYLVYREVTNPTGLGTFDRGQR